MKISMIAAVSQNGIIGYKGQLPWHLPDDLLWFKEKSMFKTLLMGRATYESLPSRLCRRSYLVLSKHLTPRVDLPHVFIARSIPEALILARSCTELMVIGGASIYKSLFPYASTLYLTTVYADVLGDTHFPPREAWGKGWYEEMHQFHPVDNCHLHPFAWSILKRPCPEQLPEV